MLFSTKNVESLAKTSEIIGKIIWPQRKFLTKTGLLIKSNLRSHVEHTEKKRKRNKI